MPVAFPDGQPTEVPAGPHFPAPGSGTPTVTPMNTDPTWPDRFAQAIEAAMASRADRKSLRAQFAARRTAGLRKRHADKLARTASSGDRLTPLPVVRIQPENPTTSRKARS